MSARTPFFATAPRPAANGAQGNELTTNTAKFTPDQSNPLHNGNSALDSSNSDPKNASSVESNAFSSNMATSTNGNLNKPLNVGSLLKRKSNQMAVDIHQHHQNISRPLPPGDDAIARPRTTQPNQNKNQMQSTNMRLLNRNRNPSQALDIIAPVPRQAARPSSPLLSTSSASGVFSHGSPFKTPALRVPGALSFSPVDHHRMDDAHIPTPPIGFSFQNAAPRSGSREQSLTRNSPRSTQEVIDIDSDRQAPMSYTLDMTLPNQTGPQRVPLGPVSAGSYLGMSNSVDSSHTLIDTAPSISNGNRALRRTSKKKRPRADHDEGAYESPEDYGGKVKRYKGQESDDGSQDDNRKVGYIGEKSLSPSQHMHSPDGHSHPRSHHPEYQPIRSPTSYQASPFARRPQETGSNPHQYPPQPQPPPVTGSSDRLGKLLGCDTDAYVEENIENYEAAVAKWRASSIVEWIAGADELATKYVEILDFVKAHMTAKVKLFATFDQKVDQHNEILGQREKTLIEVKERLVQESGNVLGR